MLGSCIRIGAKEDAKKEEEPKKESKEADSVLTGIERYSDSESPGKPGEESEGIPRFCGAAGNITESTSSMVLEEMV